METKCCENCTCYKVNPCHSCCHLRQMCSNCMRRLFEIQELPRTMSLQESKDKFGEHWEVFEAFIGKINELTRELNNVNQRLNLP